MDSFAVLTDGPSVPAEAWTKQLTAVQQKTKKLEEEYEAECLQRKVFNFKPPLYGLVPVNWNWDFMVRIGFTSI